MFFQVVGTALGIAILTACVLGLMIRRSIRRSHMGVLIGTRTDATSISHKCKDCSGGVQVLNEGRWGPFTPAQLTISAASPFVESRAANTRSCLTCAGKGFRWEDIPGPSNYIAPNMAGLVYQRKLIHWPWE